MISFQFVADNFAELEADFQREYGIDLRDALYGGSPIGGRRLTALINGLSPQSATMRRIHSSGQQWGTSEELLATLCELVDMTNRILYQAYTPENTQAWEPLEVPRPYIKRVVKQRRLSTPDEVRNFFASSAGKVRVTPPGASSPPGVN